MNEQERLQRVTDILADNAHEMCALEGDNNDIILDANMDGVQMVAKEICNVFTVTPKDNRSKRERALDVEFERMGVKPHVYHFTKNVKPFNAVTIAIEKHTWNVINATLVHVYRNHKYPIYLRPATILRKGLQKKGVYGIAICDKRDVFNKHYGRMKAKGRLLQHLLKEQQK